MHHQHTQMVRHIRKPPRTCQAFRDITTSRNSHITPTTVAVPMAMAAMVVPMVSLSLGMYRRGGIPGLKGRQRCLRLKEESLRTSDPAFVIAWSSVAFLRSMGGHRLSCKGPRRHLMMSLRVWEEDKKSSRIALQLSLSSDQGEAGLAMLGRFPISQHESLCHTKQHNARLLHLYIIVGEEAERRDRLLMKGCGGRIS